ncbi:MAG: JAB domain-containing protein [Alphaproteobacteria bacterium]|nr:JAB domain-containing protein [Alphaproteobacteria bacterium]
MAPGKSPARPHHAGHRDRLRARFMGAGALADYELLELILFRAIPQRDVKPLAKQLIAHFGSFADVISAEPALLREKIDSEAVVRELKIVQAAALHLIQGAVLNRPVLSGWSALLEYCQAAMAYEKNEQFRILFLDSQNALIANEQQQQGSVNHTPVYPREVMKRAMNLSASSIILVHNHPGGDPTPSRADIEMTKQIIEAGKPLKVAVHDHLVIGRKKTVSFRQLGLI